MKIILKIDDIKILTDESIQTEINVNSERFPNKKYDGFLMVMYNDILCYWLRRMLRCRHRIYHPLSLLWMYRAIVYYIL